MSGVELDVVTFKYLGGIVAGVICGILPYKVGKRRGLKKFAISGLIVCAVCGAFLGLLGAIPLSVIYTLVIVTIKKA
jgi:hypothetical protein